MAFRRKVKRVVDGDTLELFRGIGNSRFVRLSNVNAPEKHQFGGLKAQNILRGYVGGRTVTVNPHAVDRYGRVVATVYSNRLNVNRRLMDRLQVIQ